MTAPAPAMPLTMQRVRAAQKILRAVVPESRLAQSASLSKSAGAQVFFKLEC